MTNQPPVNPWLATRTRTGQEYDAPYAARAAVGINVHGEADLLGTLLQSMLAAPSGGRYRMLDGGCGTGRIAIELARRGIDIVGVDLDPVMLAQARINAPHLEWHLDDLSRIDLAQPFDAVLLAGNVMIYLMPGTEAATLANLARQIVPGGILVAAFEQPPPVWSSVTVDAYDRMAAAAGLRLVTRWATWEQGNWHPGDRYAVSVHQK